MLDTLRLWDLAARLPGLLWGAALHRAALRAAHAGAWEVADRLFERAAARYRCELRVEPLARLRVHQRIARVRARWHRGDGAVVEIERLLYRLPRIERLEPPFDLVDARELLATWSAAPPEESADPARPVEFPVSRFARAA